MDGEVNRYITIQEELDSETPYITAIEPGAAYVGNTVAIKGHNFGTVPGTVEFTRHIIAQNIVSWSDSEIVCEVPFGALSGNVNVITENR